MRIKVKFIGSGSNDNPFRINLPTYSVIDGVGPGNERSGEVAPGGAIRVVDMAILKPGPITLPDGSKLILIKAKFMEIKVPDDYGEMRGNRAFLSKKKIQKKYRGQSWDRPNVAEDVAATPGDLID